MIDAAGYWVKFVVNQVPATTDRPHALDYTLTMHSPDGARLVGFDNAQPVAGQGKDAVKHHKRRLRTVRPLRINEPVNDATTSPVTALG